MSSSTQNTQSENVDAEFDINTNIHHNWRVVENNLDESESHFEDYRRVYKPPYIVWEREGLFSLSGIDQYPCMKVDGWKVRVERHSNSTEAWKAIAIPKMGDYTWERGSQRLVHWAILEEAIEEANAAIDLIEHTPEKWIFTKTTSFGKHRWVRSDEKYALEITQRDRNMPEYRYYDLNVTKNPFEKRYKRSRERINNSELRRDHIIGLTIDLFASPNMDEEISSMF